jgi:hypothetical protein
MIFAVLFLLASCTVQQNDQAQTWKPRYEIVAGVNSGGIVENTDMAEVDAEPDAFTGATQKHGAKLGLHAGGHILLPVWSHEVLTGIEVMRNNQEFYYNDAQKGYYGIRTLGTTQVLLPVCFQAGFFKKQQAQGMLKVKLGYVSQFNFLSVTDSGTSLPGHTHNVYSGGVTLGISLIPFSFKNGARLGLYVDGYRGTRIYEDFYNQPGFKVPGSSYMRGGIVYQF